jgi:probable F420-dependent oxidoreductase
LARIPRLIPGDLFVAEVVYSLRIPSVQPANPQNIERFVVRAEELGFHAIWAGDHVFYPVDVLHPLHLLTWVAAKTSRIRLGQAVMLSAYLNPVLLAKAASTIDVLSGGRFSLGMSFGGSEAEFKSIGVPMNQRVGRLMESVEIMRRLWRDDNVSYDGRYNQVEGGRINPKPVQPGGVPIYLGGIGDPMLKRIARHADGWVGPSQAIDRFLAGITKVRGYCTVAGRDPDSLAIAKLQNVSIGATREAAKAQGEAHWRAYYSPSYNLDTATIYGTPEQCKEQLQVFEGADCRRVELALELAGLDLEQLEALASITTLA